MDKHRVVLSRTSTICAGVSRILLPPFFSEFAASFFSSETSFSNASLCHEVCQLALVTYNIHKCQNILMICNIIRLILLIHFITGGIAISRSAIIAHLALFTLQLHGCNLQLGSQSAGFTIKLSACHGNKLNFSNHSQCSLSPLCSFFVCLSHSLPLIHLYILCHSPGTSLAYPPTLATTSLCTISSSFCFLFSSSTYPEQSQTFRLRSWRAESPSPLIVATPAGQHGTRKQKPTCISKLQNLKALIPEGSYLQLCIHHFS